MTISTTVSIIIAAICIAIVAIAAWWLKPVLDKKRAKALEEEQETLDPASQGHQIVFIEPGMYEAPDQDTSDAKDLQEELKAESSKRPASQAATDRDGITDKGPDAIKPKTRKTNKKKTDKA